MRLVISLLCLAACAMPVLSQAEPVATGTAPAARAMVVVSEADVVREEAPPHGALGMSTAYRISDVAPGRTMEFRRRDLHPGAAIGDHVIAHDEVYYVLSGEGDVFSDGTTAHLSPGMAATASACAVSMPTRCMHGLALSAIGAGRQASSPGNPMAECGPCL